VQSVTLLAVSKTFGPPEAVREAHAAGQRAFGENYVQEALDQDRRAGRPAPAIEWHLIGPLQSNKTRVVAEAFDWVHSVDRLKIAERLSEQRPRTCRRCRCACRSTSAARPARAAWRRAKCRAGAAVAACRGRVRLRGLMAIPEPAGRCQRQREPHRALRELLLDAARAGLALDTCRWA
jgi:pyridoxal phosphate enzyme (YggS family)